MYNTRAAVALLVVSLATLTTHAQVMRRAPVVNLSMTTAWEKVDGCAKRIAIAEPERPYVTGCGNTDDTQIYRFNTSRVFEALPFSGMIVAPRGNGDPRTFVITGARDLMASAGGPLVQDQTRTCARDVATGRGPDGKYWDAIVGCPYWPDGTNFPLFDRKEGATAGGDGVTVGAQFDMSFQQLPGAAVRVTVGLTDAVKWVVNSAGGIYRQLYCKSTDADESLMPSSPFCQSIARDWEQIDGCAKSIANGGTNRVWIIGCDTDGNGEGAIMQYAGNPGGPIAAPRWTTRIGRAKEIAVDPQGRPWVVKADGSIWRWRLDIPAKGQALESDPRQRPVADPK